MRVSQMQAAWEAYHGRFTPPLNKRPRQRGDEVIVNRCKPVVDKAVAALSGRGIDFQVANEDTGAQDYLDATLRANKKMAFLQRLFITGAVTGHLVCKIVPAAPYPRLIVLDPTTVSVEHEPDDVDHILSYTIQYSATNGEDTTTDFQQVISRDGPYWQIIDRRKVGRQWQVTAVTPWPYPFNPICDSQNLPNPNSFWGLADISPDLIQINRQLNFVYSNTNRIIKYHAHPKTFVQGLQGNKLSVAPDETIVLPEGASMGMLEMSSDLASSLQFAHQLETAMDVLSRTPSLALGDLQDVPRGQVTGPSLELMLEPLIEKTAAKQALIGDMLEELCRRILAIGGYGDTLEVFVRWPEIIPSDPITTVQVAQAYLAIGVSKETVYQRLGLNWEQEREKLAREALPMPTVTNQQITDTTQESETEPEEVSDADTPQLAA